jgi:hypothetical protein
MIPGIRGLKQHLVFGARRRRVVTLSHRSGDAGLTLRARGRHVRVKINTPTRVWSEGGGAVRRSEETPLRLAFGAREGTHHHAGVVACVNPAHVNSATHDWVTTEGRLALGG